MCGAVNKGCMLAWLNLNKVRVWATQERPVGQEGITAPNLRNSIPCLMVYTYSRVAIKWSVKQLQTVHFAE